MPPCPRPACSATRWRTSPSSSPLHRSRLRQSGTSCPGVQLLPPPGRPRSRRSSLQPSSAVEPAAGQPPRPSRPPPNQAVSVEVSGPETDDPGMEMFALREMVNAPLPPQEEGRAENPLFLFPPLASRSVVPKTPRKRAVSSISGSPEGMGGCERVKLELHSHSSLASGQLWAVREGGQLHYSRTLCRNTGKCVTHADPASDRQRDARAGSLRSPSLPHRGYVGGFVGVTSTVLGGLASAPQPVSLAPPYHQTRLCDSVRPATSQVSWHPLHHSEGSGCPHLASRDRSPTGEGRDRAGPSSRYEVRVLQPLLHCTQERRWVKTNLGSARLEPGPSQAPV